MACVPCVPVMWNDGYQMKPGPGKRPAMGQRVDVIITQHAAVITLCVLKIVLKQKILRNPEKSSLLKLSPILHTNVSSLFCENESQLLQKCSK